MKRLFFLAMIGLVGCVSMSKYKELQGQYDNQTQKTTDLEAQLNQAKTSNQDLSQTKSSLEDEKSTLEKQTADLTAEKTQLESDMAQLRTKKDALEADKAALLAENAEKEKQYDGFVGQLQKEVSDGQLKITQYQNMLTVDVADKILFDSGKAEIKKDGKAILEEVGKALASSDKTIRVVGHTDNVPLLAGAAYASNWELSTARATTVVRFLQEVSKIDPKRLIAEGRGEFAPVAPNDSPENRQKNRRIEITLLDKSLVEAVELKNTESSLTQTPQAGPTTISAEAASVSPPAELAPLSSTPGVKP
jgi:chemotaxis protein MotB